jgi:hypothetical protein
MGALFWDVCELNMTRTLQWVEQAGKGGKDASVGRASWEGWQAEGWTPLVVDPKRAPAEVHLLKLRFHLAAQRGRASNYSSEASNFPLATLLSLFDPLRSQKSASVSSKASLKGSGRVLYFCEEK